MPKLHFPERLRRLRELKGWTLQFLARRARLTAATLSRYESGAREPRARSLIRLALALGVTAERMMR